MHPNNLRLKETWLTHCFVFTLTKLQDTSSRSADKKKTLPPPAADSIRLKNLKRFVRTCGLHKNYVKLFSECDSMSQKEETLERVLRKDTGFQGNKCLLIQYIII